MAAGSDRSRPRGFALSGLTAAPYTPFRSDGDLNLPVIEKQAARLVETGVTAAFVCGTTGESMSLTVDERMQVARRWTEVCGPADRAALRVIVHTGHNSLRDAAALAAHAQQIGAAATSAVPPTYYKPAGVPQAVACAAFVAAAAPGLPFYYYHIPSFATFPLSVVEFLERGRETIPNLRGMKFTHSDLMEYQRCLALAGDDLQIAWGVDEMLLGAWAVGCRAAVGSTYNYAAPIYRRMIDAFEAGDLPTARRWARLSVEGVVPLVRFGGIPTGKAIMNLISIDVGPPRLPMEPLTAEEVNAVRETYERLEFFEAVAK